MGRVAFFSNHKWRTIFGCATRNLQMDSGSKSGRTRTEAFMVEGSQRIPCWWKSYTRIGESKQGSIFTSTTYNYISTRYGSSGSPKSSPCRFTVSLPNALECQSGSSETTFQHQQKKNGKQINYQVIRILRLEFTFKLVSKSLMEKIWQVNDSIECRASGYNQLCN